MYAPTPDSEIDTMVNYADQQLDALRSIALGLTEEQARQTPCRSALSIAGLLKHTNFVLRETVKRVQQGPRLEAPTEQDYVEFHGSFTLGDEETTVGLLAEFDRLRAEALTALRSLNPDDDTMEPSAPWEGIDDARPIKWRYFLLSRVEELARHAGHADIIREQLDGELVPALVATRAGVGASGWFTPFEPKAGTITN